MNLVIDVYLTWHRTTYLRPPTQVMAELRELKADISELGRSLDGSTVSFVLRQRDPGRSQTGG